MDLNQQYAYMLLKLISPQLKKYGYIKRNQSFYLRSEETIGIIHFQRSFSSTKNKIIFTINLGICHKAIADVLFQKYDPAPNIWDAQWWTRLGHTMPENADLWWTIDENADIEQLAAYLVDNLTQYAVPEMDRLMEKDGLRSLWLSGKSPGETELMRLVSIAILEKSAGRQDKLDEAIYNLRNHSTKRSAILDAESWIERLFPGS